MKNRIKSIIAVLLTLTVTAAQAQTADNTFCFVDANGNTIADGSTVNVSELTEDPFGTDPSYISTGLSVKNTTGAEAYISAEVAVKSLANGSFQVCFPQECKSGITGSFTTGNGSVAAGGILPLNSEWIPAGTGMYGTSTISFKLRVMTRSGKFPNYKYTFKAYGPEVTVNCIYADPAGIEAVAGSENTTVNVYDITGKTVMTGADKAALSSLGKGMYIYETVKDGKPSARKKIMR